MNSIVKAGKKVQRDQASITTKKRNKCLIIGKQIEEVMELSLCGPGTNNVVGEARYLPDFETRMCGSLDILKKLNRVQCKAFGSL
jgi:hypothetical protein